MPPAAVTEPQPVPRMVLTVAETCETLTISRPTFYELVGSGRLRSVMLGRRRVVPMAEIERLLGGDEAPSQKKQTPRTS